MQRFFVLIALALSALATGCVTAPTQSLPVECFDSQSICYHGNNIDRRATRDRYGVEGQHAINRSEFNF